MRDLRFAGERLVAYYDQKSATRKDWFDVERRMSIWLKLVQEHDSYKNQLAEIHGGDAQV